MSRARRIAAAVGVGVPLLALGVLTLAAGGSRPGHVPPGVNLAGRPIGGMSAAALRRVVHTTAASYARSAIEIRAPGGGLTATGGELGLSVDEAATVRAALRTGRDSGAFRRAWKRLFSAGRSRAAPLHAALDPNASLEVITDRDQGPHSPAVEPSITAQGDRLVAVGGQPGRGISPASVAAALATARPAHDHLVVRVRRGSVEPRFGLADAQRLLPQAERLTGTALMVAAGNDTAQVPPSALRRWLRTFSGGSGLELGIEESVALKDLVAAFADRATEPVDAGFAVAGDQVKITPSRPGKSCCAPEAPERVAAALGSRPPEGTPVSLPLRTIEPDRSTEKAGRLGVNERVSTFTTHHHAGEPRVHNIHLIADMIRGTLIEPGGSFSVNGRVGPRTAEKGFLEAPVIDEHSKFSADIGGGISQFSTTLFNAAFFAGLEIPTYSAHGLYISRYPFGREATLSFPSPDLVVRNNSPYGVLIWTAYTDTDITVSLYSTKWVDADQTGQTIVERPAKPAPDRDPAKPPLGPCQAVTTERTRRYVADGHTTPDKFYALYRPEEGAECPK